MGVVYVATNKVNGKQYVGITMQSLERRKCGHEEAASQGSSNYFHAALRKYSTENFDWQVLQEAESWEDLCVLEILYIRDFKTRCPDGYNLTAGGGGVVGLVHSAASKSKMGASHRARFDLPGAREARGLQAKQVWERLHERGYVSPLKGTKFTSEHCEKLSASMLGNKRAAGNQSRKGKKMSVEARAKISAGLAGNQNTKGKKLTVEHRAKLSAKLVGNQRTKGRAQTEEWKVGHSQWWDSLPAEEKARIKAQQSAAAKDWWASLTGEERLEVVERRAEAARAYWRKKKEQQSKEEIDA